MNSFLETLYIKIYLSRLFARLQSLDDSSSPARQSGYVGQIAKIYADLRSLSERYGGRIGTVYNRHTVFLSDLQLAIQQEDAVKLTTLSTSLKTLLNEIYDAVRAKRSFKKIRFVAAAAGVVLLTALLVRLYAPVKRIFITEREQYDMIAHQAIYEETTLKDLFALKDALQRYYDENNSYPKSSGGWDGIIAPFGQAKKDWIPGLAPKYIPVLPRDPRRSADPMKQYMYKSNGTDFKLIAHYPVGMTDISKAHPDMVDARRQTWAIGIWTRAAAGW